jgi:hypothetical protein
MRLQKTKALLPGTTYGFQGIQTQTQHTAWTWAMDIPHSMEMELTGLSGATTQKAPVARM